MLSYTSMDKKPRPKAPLRENIEKFLKRHPDAPNWEVEDAIGDLMPQNVNAFYVVVTRARQTLGIETYRIDKRGDSQVVIPVRLPTPLYKRLAKGGKHVGYTIEEVLTKFSA